MVCNDQIGSSSIDWRVGADIPWGRRHLWSFMERYWRQDLCVLCRFDTRCYRFQGVEERVFHESFFTCLLLLHTLSNTHVYRVVFHHTVVFLSIFFLIVVVLFVSQILNAVHAILGSFSKLYYVLCIANDFHFQLNILIEYLFRWIFIYLWFLLLTHT